MAKGKRQVVCTYSIATDSEPRMLGEHRCKRQWLVKLYTVNENIAEEDAQNGLRDTLRATKACYLSQMFDIINQRLMELMDQHEQEVGEYTDAGFEIIKLT